MNKIKLVCDSTLDLNDELKKSLNVLILPLSVTFGEETYFDGVDINTEMLYQKVAETKMLPKTAAISIGIFLETFSKLLDEGYDIIFTGISSKLSKTYENALLAAREIDEKRILIIDSLNLSTGSAFMLLRAKEYIDNGDSLDVIETKLKEDRAKVKSQFVIPTMEYLYKGGRCSSLAKIFGTMLKIKPLIVVRDGAMSVGAKPRGTMRVALNKMLDMFKDELENISQKEIFVTHSLNPSDAIYLREEITKVLPNVKIYETVAGCVISSHCGKDTIGILYMVK